MGLDPLGEARWEEVGWIGIDGATCAFGDASALGPEFIRSEVSDGVQTDVPLVVLGTGADLELPVEVVRRGGEAVAARMCITNDVDEVDGRWVECGVLEISSGVCAALDPTRAPHAHYRLDFAVTPGRYRAEIFELRESGEVADRLALRVRLA